mmetsp:Transcript_39941/g.158965  ORF Transcript_39941/g.158965 Transcript_39941/m.158965 type:complete len:683 (-) Transcript_39941:3005-5053(-)|eukprot:CAMPEP_0113956734 /NCGR_PEP_ID=MMETSP0011_2-20120614/2252_1 /TAXON_ID=101924 /ORGANISM="Rhodosorus marinus" /LENGTH=682 /DNA_ID=CAMNT_0000966965 /DNA_START=1208 /DNA_END=3256 /DNA_ORIENTATION=+ /assembly_acc=CAM_ASM_000156
MKSRRRALRPRSTREQGRKRSTTSFVSGIVVGLILFSLVSLSGLFKLVREEAAWAEKQRSSQVLSDSRTDGGVVVGGRTDEVGREPPRPFTVVILAMNRPWALKRLLKSIDQAYYANDRVNLDIFVDMLKNRTHDSESVRIADSFVWNKGSKRVILRPRNMGLVLSWLTCWNATSDKDRAVILEDDLEVSKLYYRFLKEANEKYNDLEDLAAYSLQRATLIPLNDGNKQIQHGSNPAYLYRLVGTWGFSPKAKKWTEFQNWFFPRFDNKDFKPFVEGLSINKWYNGREWSHWFLKFCDEERLFNLYGNMPNTTTLSANWREPGEHYGSGPAKGKEFEIFSERPDYDFQLPRAEHLVRIGWNGRLHPDFHSVLYRENIDEMNKLIEYGKQGEFLMLSLYNEYFIIWLRNFLCNVELLKIRPKQIALVTNDKKAHEQMQTVEGVHSVYLKFPGGEASRGNTFSTPGYIELMLNRARLVLELLRHGVTTLLVDLDQTWLEDPMPWVKQLADKSGVDVVGTITTQNELAGNFLYFLPTTGAVNMYKEVVRHFEKAFKDKNIADDSLGNRKVSLPNDQTLITSIALRNKECELELLDRFQFCDGRWYKGAYSNDTVSLRPVMINNNFVEGNQEKIHRAVGFGHMFYNNETNKCNPPERLRAYYQGNSIYYTWQDVLDRKRGADVLKL